MIRALRPAAGAATVVFFILLAALAPAAAHAYVVATTPAAGVVVDNAPATVTVQFDEPVTLPDGPALQVLDAAGRRVDKNDAVVDPDDATAVVVHVKPLVRGAYSVRWRVVSADTHVVHGTFSFGYGVAAGTAVAAEDTVFDPSSPLASTLRWLSLTGIVAASGALFFGLAFRTTGRTPFTATEALQMRYGCGLALIANAGLFITQSAGSAGSLTAGISAGALGGTLHSPFGVYWFARMIALVGLLLCTLSRGPLARTVGACVAATILATLTLAGHAGGAPAWGSQATLAVADWIHLAATSAWLGGLGVLTAGILGSQLAERQRREWLARFTGIAIPAVTLTILTGTYAGLAHEPRPLLLLTTPWGDALAIKIVLVAVLLVFGLLSLRSGMGIQRFNGRVLFAELLLALAVLFATGALVGQAPPFCMFMPPGSVMPPDAKMPPGMQMCLLPPKAARGVAADVS